MFEYSYSKIGLDQLLYTDTDASKFRYSKFLEWKDWVDTNNIQVPHWKEVEKIDTRYANHKIFEHNSKVFGAFEDELEDYIGDNYTFYCLEKKSWLYRCDDEVKFRFKGINPNAQLLTLKEDFIDFKVSRKKTGELVVEHFLCGDEREIYEFYESNKHNSINNNALKFFEQIYTTKEAFVLMNSFRKIVKNSSRNVMVGEEGRYNKLINSIQVRHQIKRVRIK